VRPILALFAIGMLLVAAGCGGQGSPGPSGKLETLSSVDRFARAFEDDAGHARLVLLLSPT
jgi:hypothetical protein